ncbi:hypothetical protein ZIOFF_007979 [Zingiber officinale]|uniref:Uncharacterized protein n=1 Tax=Zingiber officinale TaxID=94328 RepID=A0A8J5I2X0_ZINOF|nr:hypothetical protein ZIOFF_007979 [Zingiber officinale]
MSGERCRTYDRGDVDRSDRCRADDAAHATVVTSIGQIDAGRTMPGGRCRACDRGDVDRSSEVLLRSTVPVSSDRVPPCRRRAALRAEAAGEGAAVRAEAAGEGAAVRAEAAGEGGEEEKKGAPAASSAPTESWRRRETQKTKTPFDLSLIPLMPFSYPGYNLGIKVIQLSLANLLHGFRWNLPAGKKAEELSMEEIFGLSTPKKEPLLVVVEPKLPVHLY